MEFPSTIYVMVIDCVIKDKHKFYTVGFFCSLINLRNVVATSLYCIDSLT
jgi:hypothetical protein